MSTDLGKLLIQAFGGPSEAVNAALRWQNRLWSIMFAMGKRQQPGGKGRIVPLAILRELASVFQGAAQFSAPAGLEITLREQPESAPSANAQDLNECLIEFLRREKLLWSTEHIVPEPVVSLKVLETMRFIRVLFSSSIADQELRFFVFAGIRRSHGVALSAETARVFHALAETINDVLIQPGRTRSDEENTPLRLAWDYHREFLSALKRINVGDNDARQQCFIEAIRAVNYLQPDPAFGHVVCRTQNVDAEFLISNLFGLPTGIQGFDDLFGGGGLLLVEQLKQLEQLEQPRVSDQGRATSVRGRVVLAAGRYATGKSLLSMQVAVEVARKGGLAYVLALEQPPEECLYTLRAMQGLPKDGSIDIITRVQEVPGLYGDGDGPPQRGALVFLRATRGSYIRLLEGLAQSAEWMQPYTLRLIIVDPLNAIHRGEEGDGRNTQASETELRIKTLDLLSEIKRSGVNVWFNIEESPSTASSTFEQNIADTVLHLSVKAEHGSVQRYIEVQKSRLQREQRGKHPFSITTGVGITIYPSSAAVSERIRSRKPNVPDVRTNFGLTSLDRILGDGALCDGDVVLLQGPGGCHKTTLGLQFLLHAPSPHSVPKKQWQKQGADRRNLLLATGDTDMGVRWLLGHQFEARLHRDVRPQIYSLPDGHVQPGQILQAINDQIAAIRQNSILERVMVSNVSHWVMNCPFLRDDETFGNTLVELLRRQDVTSLIVCGESTDVRSSLPGSLFENADTAIQFDHVEFQGKAQVMLRVIKTRGMSHRTEWFELVVGSRSVELRAIPSLVRVASNGSVAPVPIRLFLHSESEMQSEYNDQIQRSFQAVLSRNVEVDSQNGVLVSRSLSLGRHSVLDELQLLQVDEFQLPRTLGAGKADLELHTAPRAAWRDERWNDLLEGMRSRVERHDDTAIGVPLYSNFSLLCYRKDTVDERAVHSWHSLAQACDQFYVSTPDKLFFDFVGVSSENYNSLFFEILLSMWTGPPLQSACDLGEWISAPEALETLVLIHRLCRRAHLAKIIQRAAGTQKLEHERPIKVDLRAHVWRHWYSTLNQMLNDLGAAERGKITVAPLPGGISVAGEWYLTVPAHSAAPEVALTLVRSLTSGDAEMERLRLGVGLPTRESFYVQDCPDVETPVSPYFSMDIGVLGRLIRAAFRRSQLAGYNRLSGVLSAHIRRLLEMEKFELAQARTLASSLRARIDDVLINSRVGESETAFFQSRRVE